jgi:hypothetical protein
MDRFVLDNVRFADALSCACHCFACCGGSTSKSNQQSVKGSWRNSTASFSIIANCSGGEVCSTVKSVAT